MKQVKRQIAEVTLTYDGYEFQMTLPTEWHNDQFNEWKAANKHEYKIAKAEMKIEFANLEDVEVTD